MNLEDEKYYETFFNLFATEGWELFTTTIKENLESFSIEGLEDEKHLRHVQGQIFILKNISNFETNTRTSYDQIISEEQETNFAS
tara:strand:- start:44 stop:298 length:255 start_codon:yes stop_codon:yes gene_type:complete